ATPPSCCARSRPRSTSPATRAKSARRSGRKARRRSSRRSTSSARSDDRRRSPRQPSPARGAALPHQLPRSLPSHRPARAGRHGPGFPEETTMLDADLKEQLKAYLERLVRPVEIVATLDDGEASRDMRALLEDIVAVSDKVALTEAAPAEGVRVPSVALTSPGEALHLRFAGLPLGHEFTSLVLALLQVGGYPSKEPEALQDQVRALEGEYRFETYFSQSCQNCPDVVQALDLAAVLNPRIQHVAIDGSLFQDEVEQRQIMSVPTVYLNGELFDQGRMTLEQIVARLDTNAGKRDAEKIAAKEAFDVLVVGGGPAGAAAAIYAARKGIRTGVAAERFGGQ